MKARTLQLSLIATALLSLGVIASPARADSVRGEWRQDSREISQDRRELRNDYRELAEDRADYRRERAEGDIAGMRRERMEIRQDLREISRDRAELRNDLRDRRQDAGRHQDRDGGNRHAGWTSGQRGRGEQRAEMRHDQRDSGQDYRQQHQAQHVNWRTQGTALPGTAASSSQQNNGRHTGWQNGRGNPHGG